MKYTSTTLVFLVGSMIASFAAFVPAQSSSRDYMTDAEIELVRDAQDIDARIDVLTKMIDRRFAALNINVGGATISSKESDKWGPAPAGSRIELIEDIRKLLDKAIDDIDNVAAHPAKIQEDVVRSEKQKEKEKLRFPSSVKNLAAAARRYQPALKSMLEKAADEKEKGSIMNALESCDEILAAIVKLPAETKQN